MAIIEKNDLKIINFEIFENKLISHGIFSRHGGVSPAPWDSLNLGGTVGDSRANVVENRKRIFAAIDRPVETLFDSWQVHGTEVLIAAEPRPLNGAHVKGDAILTNRPDVTLFMRFADCVPILFFDPVHNAIGIAHAGWKGTLARIAAITIETMNSVYNSKPNETLVGIGPSIGPDHYEVGEDVASLTCDVFGRANEKVLHRLNGKYHLDLWEANRLILFEAGVREIQVAEICTACDKTDWYSHRGDHGKTGRFGALLALN